MPIFGVIADDFTGASDAASFLVKGGLSTLLFDGIPEESVDPSAADAFVIALKSRTQKTEDAVRDSLTAARFLLDAGAKQLYFKYCSTFDSTPKGNIGPVADALMDLTGAPYTVLAPALPVNGRIVRDGCLYVNGVPLQESPMKNHPLTPMWDADLARLMAPQSRYPAYKTGAPLIEPAAGDVPVQKTQTAPGIYDSSRNAGHQSTAPDSAPLYEVLPPTGTDAEGNETTLSSLTTPYYIIPDYTNDEDGEAIARTYAHLPLLTGGSGLLEGIARHLTEGRTEKPSLPPDGVPGRALLLAGSCSKATLTQIAAWQAKGYPSYKMEPEDVLTGTTTVDTLWSFVREHENASDGVLLYSSDTPEKVKEYQKLGTDQVAAALEGLTAAVAARALREGYTRIISAGGETSGAVTKALHLSACFIGNSVAPGVPIMTPYARPDVRLVLKSGNFGQEDFFEKATLMTGL